MKEFKEYVKQSKAEFIVVKCADCDRPLMNFLKTAETEDVHFVKVHCVNKKCAPDDTRGESWVHELTGKYAYSPIKERDYIHEMSMNEDDIMEIHLRKKKQ